MAGDIVSRPPDRVKKLIYAAFDIHVLYAKICTRSPSGPPSPTPRPSQSRP